MRTFPGQIAGVVRAGISIVTREIHAFANGDHRSLRRCTGVILRAGIVIVTGRSDVLVGDRARSALTKHVLAGAATRAHGPQTGSIVTDIADSAGISILTEGPVLLVARKHAGGGDRIFDELHRTDQLGALKGFGAGARGADSTAAVGFTTDLVRAVRCTAALFMADIAFRATGSDTRRVLAFAHTLFRTCRKISAGIGGTGTAATG